MMGMTRHAILTLIFALGPLPALLTGCWSWKPQWRLERRIQDALEPYTDRLAATYVHDPNNPLSGEDIFGASLPVTLEGGYEVHEAYKSDNGNPTFWIRRDNQNIMYVQFYGNRGSNVHASMAYYPAASIPKGEIPYPGCSWTSQSNAWMCDGILGPGSIRIRQM